jgi:sigma-E factor negative regulatory protein RseB
MRRATLSRAPHTRALRTSTRLSALLLVWAAGAAASAMAAAQAPAQKTGPDPTAWLERMNHALNTRNYDGTFSHWHGGAVEMLRIIHRVQDGQVSERLVSLDGSGRELIRRGASLTCYLPDKRTVLVERRPPQESLVGFPGAVNGSTAGLYDVREVTRMRLNRRDTHLITISPKDNYRYGYRLWIDDSTAMPLKSQLCDARGNLIEQIVFANLTLSAHIPDSAFKPEVSTEGFQWLRSDPTGAPDTTPVTEWSAQKLPPGFRMLLHRLQTLPGAPGRVDHLVFSDGLASVSVFIEVRPVGPEQARLSQSATVGSSSAFSIVVDGHKITAVGEVPPETVRFIASQVKAEDSVSGAPRP